MSIATWPGSQQDYQIKKTPFQVSLSKRKEIRLAKKSLLSGTEYGPLSASHNIFREIVSDFLKWVCLIKLLATIIMEILRISEIDDL